MSSELKIRFAKSQDAQAILEVHHHAIRSKAATFYSPEIIEEWTYDITPEKIGKQSEELTDPTFICLIAESEARVLGFGIAIPKRHELRAVYVAPNSIGQVGSSLLHALEEECIKRGCFELEMDSSINAEAFYHKHGYQSVRRGAHILRSGQPMDCVKMVKSLRTQPL